MKTRKDKLTEISKSVLSNCLKFIIIIICLVIYIMLYILILLYYPFYYMLYNGQLSLELLYFHIVEIIFGTSNIIDDLFFKRITL